MARVDEDHALFWEGSALYCSGGARTTQHAHHDLKLAVPIEGIVGVRGRAAVEGDVGRTPVLLAGDEVNEMWCAGVCVTFFVAPEHARRLFARTTALARGAERLAGAEGARVVEVVRAHIDDLASAPDASEVAREVFSGLERGWTPRPVHWRVRRVQALLEQAPRHTCALADLAQAVGTSPSHLSRQFRAQTGTTLRRYALWLRLRAAYRAMASGLRPADAAHAAGFADHAHFCRTARRMMGRAPAEVPQYLGEGAWGG